MVKATTKEAVNILISRGMSKYRIAKELDMSPVSVNHWLSKTAMSEKTAAKVKELFGIEITDAFGW